MSMPLWAMDVTFADGESSEFWAAGGSELEAFQDALENAKNPESGVYASVQEHGTIIGMRIVERPIE